MITPVCETCRGLGVMRAFNRAKKWDSLALCTCEAAKRNGHLNLPTFGPKMAEEFEPYPCPLSWFLPDNERRSVAHGEMLASLDGKVGDWNKRVADARAFWTQWGNKFSDTATQWWQE